MAPSYFFSPTHHWNEEPLRTHCACPPHADGNMPCFSITCYVFLTPSVPSSPQHTVVLLSQLHLKMSRTVMNEYEEDCLPPQHLPPNTQGFWCGSSTWFFLHSDSRISPTLWVSEFERQTQGMVPESLNPVSTCCH